MFGNDEDGFDKTGVKNSMKSILNYKKPLFWIIVVVLIAGTVMGVYFLSNHTAKEEKTGTETESTTNIDGNQDNKLGVEALFRDYNNDKDSIIGLEYDEIRKLYGEPSGSLSDSFGDVYQKENGDGIMVYYDPQTKTVNDINAYRTGPGFEPVLPYDQDKEIGGKSYKCTDDKVTVPNLEQKTSPFRLLLFKDGTVSYSQPVYSSHIASGNWNIEDNLLTIIEGTKKNYFDVVDGDLIFRAEGSSGFSNFPIEDGTVFKRDYNVTGTGIVPSGYFGN